MQMRGKTWGVWKMSGGPHILPQFPRLLDFLSFPPLNCEAQLALPNGRLSAC